MNDMKSDIHYAITANIRRFFEVIRKTITSWNSGWLFLDELTSLVYLV